MKDRRAQDRDSRDAEPLPDGTTQCGDADRERQHPRVHVSLERIGAGPGDLVPERQDQQQRRRHPRIAAKTAREPDGGRRERQQRGDVGHGKDDRQIGAGCSRHAGEEIVGQPRAHLWREQHPVAREQRRIHLQRDRWSVKSLISSAVPITAGVGSREDHEQHAAGGETRPAVHMVSSAVCP